MAPDFAAPWFNLSLVHKRRHDWGALLETSRIAAALDQENEGALWNQGIAAAALGDWEQAREAWPSDCLISTPRERAT